MTGRDGAAGTRPELAAALAATRRTFDGESEQARDTERRILTATRGPTRIRKASWIAPLAAAFVVSGAFASEFGGRLAELGRGWFTEDVGHVVPAPSAPSAKRLGAVHTPALPTASNASTPAAVEAAAEAAEPTLAPTSGRSEPRVATHSRPAPSSSAATTEAVNELAVYKEAHSAHFGAHDYARALGAWDRYLAVAPTGTFALEARYNRAVALHRLGRRSDALAALRPFAEGAYGRYRRDEAQTLIDELR